MARPIEPTPTVTGEDAERLLASLQEHATESEMRERREEAARWLAEVRRPKGALDASPGLAYHGPMETAQSVRTLRPGDPVVIMQNDSLIGRARVATVGKRSLTVLEADLPHKDRARVAWRFRRADGLPWGGAGTYNSRRVAPDPAAPVLTAPPPATVTAAHPQPDVIDLPPGMWPTHMLMCADDRMIGCIRDGDVERATRHVVDVYYVEYPVSDCPNCSRRITLVAAGVPGGR